ncbi:MAG: metal ABC transporter solute-binding protein, Zn/Mn family [Cellvibrionaceae bacterium]
MKHLSHLSIHQKAQGKQRNRLIWLVTTTLLLSSCFKASDDGLPEVLSNTEAKPITVIASIKPLALIAQDIVGDTGVVDVLVPPTSSPHDYAMKMSDAQKLSKADKVIWFGAELEQFLSKQIKGIESKQVITISDALNHNVRDQGDRGHAEVGSNHPEHSEDSEHPDLHLWLSPIKAQQIAEVIGQTLIADQKALGNSQTAKNLESNLKQTLTNYDLLSNQLKTLFEPVQQIGFVVYHKAYGHLIEQYHLNQVGYISAHPEIPVGIKHMAELEKTVVLESKNGSTKCLFVESAHQSNSAEEIAKRLHLRVKALDILGSSTGVSTYKQLMEKIARDMLNCLKS